MTTPAWLVWTKDDTGLAKVFTLQLASICLYMTTWPELEVAQPCKRIYLTTCKRICLYMSMTTQAWLQNIYLATWKSICSTYDHPSLVGLDQRWHRPCTDNLIRVPVSGQCTVHCVWPVHCLHIIVALYHVCRCQHKMQLLKYNFPLLTCSAKAWCKVQTFVCRSLRACSANW